MAQAETHSRFLALDGLRGVAAIVVVIHHVYWTMRGDPMFVFGPLAVDFFFILSGFVISFAYEQRLRDGRISFAGYARRRIVRLYPLIVLGALLGLSFHLWSGGKDALDDPFAYLAASLLCLPFGFAQNGAYDFLNPPAWSLFFEIFVSLAYGALATRLSAVRLLVLVVIAGAALAWGGLHFNTNQLGIAGENFVFGFARVIFSFGTGVLLQRLHRRRPLPIAVPALVPAAVIVGIMGMPYLARGEMPLNLIAVLAVFPAMIFIGASSPEGGRASRWLLGKLGDISYPLYIIHWPLFWWINAQVIPRLPPADVRIYGLIATALAIILSYAVLKLYDEPVRAWLTRRMG